MEDGGGPQGMYGTGPARQAEWSGGTEKQPTRPVEQDSHPVAGQVKPQAARKPWVHPLERTWRVEHTFHMFAAELLNKLEDEGYQIDKIMETDSREQVAIYAKKRVEFVVEDGSVKPDPIDRIADGVEEFLNRLDDDDHCLSAALRKIAGWNR